MKLLTISLPNYKVDTEPDHETIGRTIDGCITMHFPGKTVAVRGVSSSAHPNKTIDDLIEIIKQTGTDRYDPKRAGDRYENIQNKQIDLFAFRKKVTPKMELFKDISWGFYHGAKAIHGAPVRIDLLTIYDASQFKSVAHRYEGRDDIKRDGFVFKNPSDKPAAVLGIIKIT